MFCLPCYKHASLNDLPGFSSRSSLYVGIILLMHRRSGKYMNEYFLCGYGKKGCCYRSSFIVFPMEFMRESYAKT